jgi:DNA-binding response OmpR family regulator
MSGCQIRRNHLMSPFDWDLGFHPDKSVLVIDDDSDVRELIARLLKKEGIRVETASDGRQALRQALKKRPSLVLLDLGLPGLAGEAVAHRLRSAYGEALPIILVSASDEVDHAARRVGAHSYLSKPFEPDEVLSLVQDVLEKEADG